MTRGDVLTMPADALKVISVTREWGHVYRIVTESAKYGRVSQTVLLMPRSVAEAPCATGNLPVAVVKCGQ